MASHLDAIASILDTTASDLLLMLFYLAEQGFVYVPIFPFSFPFSLLFFLFFFFFLGSFASAFSSRANRQKRPGLGGI